MLTRLKAKPLSSATKIPLPIAKTPSSKAKTPSSTAKTPSSTLKTPSSSLQTKRLPSASDSERLLCEACKGTIESKYFEEENEYLEKRFSGLENYIKEIIEREYVKRDSYYQRTQTSLDFIREQIKKFESIESSVHDKFVRVETCIKEIRDIIENNALGKPEHESTPVVNSSSFRESNNNNQEKGKKSMLIYGDSNTKHIKLDNDRVTCQRVPTYFINDIEPAKCKDFTTIWIHVGINDMKSRECNANGDSYIHKTFKILMRKLEEIRLINPSARVILSPIMPTGVHTITQRAAYFNRLLFDVKNHWWLELSFNDFCISKVNKNLHTQYRCFGNPRDRIHLGSKGIKALTSKVMFALGRTDRRSYASVLIGPPYKYNYYS